MRHHIVSLVLSSALLAPLACNDGANATASGGAGSGGTPATTGGTGGGGSTGGTGGGGSTGGTGGGGSTGGTGGGGSTGGTGGVGDTCADFSEYPDNTTLGNPFSLNGYQFTGLGTEPFVNSSGSIVGLQFHNNGLEIGLPELGSAVALDVASFTPTPLTLSALDSGGMSLSSTMAPGDNTLHTVMLSSDGISQVKIEGGGNEGVLVKICTTPSTP